MRGLVAHPRTQEFLLASRRAQLREPCRLMSAEGASRDGQPVDGPPRELDVDADGTCPGEGVEGLVAGVGQVEAQPPRLVVTSGPRPPRLESRLPVLIRSQGQAARVALQIATE